MATRRVVPSGVVGRDYVFRIALDPSGEHRILRLM